MVYSKVPTDWFENWSEDGTNITVPLATFPEMTAAEADAATGDFPNILYAILHKAREKFKALAVADRPAYMSIYKTETPSADVEGESQVTFTVQFTVSAPAGSKNVKAEA